MCSWGFCAEDAESFVFTDAIGEGEGVRMFPKNWSKWRLLKKIIFVRVGDSTPVITGLESAS